MSRSDREREKALDYSQVKRFRSHGVLVFEELLEFNKYKQHRKHTRAKGKTAPKKYNNI